MSNSWRDCCFCERPTELKQLHELLDGHTGLLDDGMESAFLEGLGMVGDRDEIIRAGRVNQVVVASSCVVNNKASSLQGRYRFARFDLRELHGLRGKSYRHPLLDRLACEVHIIGNWLAVFL